MAPIWLNKQELSTRYEAYIGNLDPPGCLIYVYIFIYSIQREKSIFSQVLRSKPGDKEK